MARDTARDSLVPLSEEEAEPRRLALLLRLPRRLAYERLAYHLRTRLLALSPLGWQPKNGTVVEPQASVPDTWPGIAALGGEIARGTFPLLGRSLKEPQPPFRPVGVDPRWVAALNGFSWLRHLRAMGGDGARRAARDLVALWIERESRWSPVAWQPAVAGERIAAWLGHYEFFAVSAELEFRRRLMGSLHRQASHLAAVLPAGQTGARLIAALRGLAFAAAAFPEGRRWFARVNELLARELAQQVLPDGGHVERAPATQLAVLRDLIDIRAAFNAAGAPVPGQLGDAIEQMAPTLRLLQHGDGALSLFNGGEEGDALMVDLVLQRASGRSRPHMSAPQSGFQRLQAGRLVAIVDAGAPPPPGLDDEAAAGTLAFEISVGRERLVVNCGVHPTDTQWRRLLRATAAHSTLTLADHNAAQVLPDGGLGRRPGNVTCRREEADGCVWLDMSHDGYRSLFGATYHRKLYLDATGEDLRGEERLEGTRAGLGFAVRFHLHPDVQTTLAQSGDAVLLRLPKGDGWRLRVKHAELAVEPSIYLGRAGEPRRSQQVVLTGSTQAGSTVVHWALQRESRSRRG